MAALPKMIGVKRSPVWAAKTPKKHQKPKRKKNQQNLGICPQRSGFFGRVFHLLDGYFLELTQILQLVSMSFRIFHPESLRNSCGMVGTEEWACGQVSPAGLDGWRSGGWRPWKHRAQKANLTFQPFDFQGGELANRRVVFQGGYPMICNFWFSFFNFSKGIHWYFRWGS